MKRQILSFLFILVLLALTAPAYASVIYVSGDQTGTWSADTVIVTAEVRVPPGQSLSIMPGVEVLFSVYCKLIVDNEATLLAAGTPAEFIRFDVLPPDTAWHGIRFLGASNASKLEYCILTNGSATGAGDDHRGGAIFCAGSSPTISSNIIHGNSASYFEGSVNSGSGGGIYSGTNSFPTISRNTIAGNAAGAGGGISLLNSDPTINGNTISGNSATSVPYGYGGGIDCYHSDATISSNTISENSAANGGGIYLDGYSHPTICGNTIRANVAGNGGGIYCYFSYPYIIRNTICDNLANVNGGGIHFYYDDPTLFNCVLWGNSPGQIYCYLASPLVNYSNIQGGYTGTGNISAEPLFVNAAQNDYRLQWGSPCIDSGDPNPIYNDPDGTRADMGAWYYNQSTPVRILLTPYNAPIQIPSEGGSFQYAIQATDIGSGALSTQIWCEVTLPDSSIYGPVLGPATIGLESGQTLSRVRTQTVPAAAPAGMYRYNGYAVAEGDTSMDSFTFVKLGGGGSHLRVLADTPALQNGSWSNAGEEFGLADVGAGLASPWSGQFGISISPNPFNPTTILRFTLPEASAVRLEVFDVNGRNVGAHGCAPLSESPYPSGVHEITFDGSGLPSGVYYYRLIAGMNIASGKLVLMK